MPVPAERRTFKVTVAGQTTELSTNSEGLAANERYTFVAQGKEDSSTTLTALNDMVREIEPGKAKLRVVHAAPAAGDLDIVAAGRREPVFDGVNPNTATDFADVDAGAKSLEIRKDDQRVASTRISDMNLEAGKAYTVIVAGRSGTMETIRLENGPVTNETARR
jgi:hypothetical protein